MRTRARFFLVGAQSIIRLHRRRLLIRDRAALDRRRSHLAAQDADERDVFAEKPGEDSAHGLAYIVAVELVAMEGVWHRQSDLISRDCNGINFTQQCLDAPVQRLDIRAYMSAIALRSARYRMNQASAGTAMAAASEAGTGRSAVIVAGSAWSDRVDSGAGISRIVEGERTRSRSDVGRAEVGAARSERDCSTGWSRPDDVGPDSGVAIATASTSATSSGSCGYGACLMVKSISPNRRANAASSERANMPGQLTSACCLRRLHCQIVRSEEPEGMPEAAG